MIEMRYLNNMWGVIIMDRIGNWKIRRTVVVQMKLSDRVEKNGLRCFRYVERMGEERVVKRILYMMLK